MTPERCFDFGSCPVLDAGDEIVAAVKKNNVPVDYIVFPDEGHGFTKKKNQIEGYAAALKFLDRYLKGTAETR